VNCGHHTARFICKSSMLNFEELKGDYSREIEEVGCDGDEAGDKEATEDDAHKMQRDRF
jgi:hypothetical protein